MYLLNVDNSIIIRYYKIRKNIISFEVSINTSCGNCYRINLKKSIDTVFWNSKNNVIVNDLSTLKLK